MYRNNFTELKRRTAAESTTTALITLLRGKFTVREQGAFCVTYTCSLIFTFIQTISYSPSFTQNYMKNNFNALFSNNFLPSFFSLLKIKFVQKRKKFYSFEYLAYYLA